jgi:hypothetical protein
MGTNDEFYAGAMRQRLNELDAERMRYQADLAVSLSDNDQRAASEEIEHIASIDARRNHLIALAQSEAARNQPRYQERESIHDSRRAPSTGDDALEIVNYGKMPNDPTRVTADEYNRQSARLTQEKAKGNYPSG